MPPLFRVIGSETLYGIPYNLMLLAVIAVIFTVVLSRSRFGREVYITGGNPVTARLLGINADRVTIIGYVSGPNLAHWAVFHYDMQPDLMALKGPGLILSDTADSLHPIDKRVAKMRPDFEYLEFSQGSIFAFMAEPKRWARIAADFKRRIDATRPSVLV